MKQHILFTLCLLVCLSACRKDKDLTRVEENIHSPIELSNYQPEVEDVTSSVIGIIIDEMGNPIPQAQVSLGNLSRLSDQSGLFQFDAVTMNAKGTFIQIEKEGYFLAGRRFYPKADSKSNIRIQLIEKVFNESFSSSEGATININGDGGSIVFEANSIKTNSGEPYNGTVWVASKWLNPTLLSTLDQMPGALQGVNMLNEEQSLATYGMVAVELQGSAGQTLNIADNFTAQLNMKVPESLQSSAPAEIPLWSFNYTYGIWVEEGKAVLDDGMYKGAVSHFSFWNCDYPGKTVEFDVTLIDETTQQALQNMLVTLSFTDESTCASGYTGAEGNVAGLVPQGEALILRVYSSCGTILHTQNIGPFDDDTSLGIIEIDNITTLVELSGQILNCDNELTENGIIIVKIENELFYYSIDTNPFSIVVSVCDATEIDLYAGDLESNMQSTTVTLPVSANINTGAIATCANPLLGFLKVTIEGTTRYFEINNTRQLPDTITPYLTYIDFINQSSEAPGDTLLGQLSFTNSTGSFEAGDFSDSNGIDIIIDTENGWRFLGHNEFDTFIVEEYGPYTGTLLSGYMSGFMENEYAGQSTMVFVECEFNVLRSQ